MANANTTMDLIRYFQSEDPEKILKMKEFKDFWESCSDEEKVYFRNVDLATGLLRDL